MSWLYWVAISLLAIPLVPGFAGILLPAFSYIPSLGLETFNLSAFEDVFHWNGVYSAILTSIFTGGVSTLLAVCATFIITRNLWQTSAWERLQTVLAPILALPHAAFAIGFLFTFSQTGVVARIISPITMPLLTGDRWGVGLIIILAVKEIPFLIIMSLSVLHRINVNKQLKGAASIGYAPQQSWHAIIFPQWLASMRLPIFAVLAFGLSNVEIAYIIGPQRPPTLSVLVWQWFNDPDLTLFPRAAAGSAILLLLGLFSLLAWWVGERVYLTFTHKKRLSGMRNFTFPLLSSVRFLPILPLVTLPAIILWSFTLRWRFTHLIPSQFTLRYWSQEMAHIGDLIMNSLFIAMPTVLITLVLVCALLQFSTKKLPSWLVALPLVVPQLSVLFGIQVFSYWLDIGNTWLWVIWSHFLFVFPYLYLSLSASWANIDPRIEMTAQSLGLSPWECWWKVKVHYLLPAICVAMGMGLSVSLSLYLPTQMLSGGRIATITTEAIALTSGGDRRITAIYALLQAAIPLFIFWFSLRLQRKAQARLSPHYREATTRSALAEQVDDTPSYHSHSTIKPDNRYVATNKKPNYK